MNQRGQVTVLVLGMALLAFAVAGLAVDGTRAWLLRRTLQNAADAAALAGAGELDQDAYYGSGGHDIALDADASGDVARDWLSARATGARASVTTSEERVIVEMRDDLPTTFLSLVGIHSISVGVRSDAAPVAETP